MLSMKEVQSCLEMVRGRKNEFSKQANVRYLFLGVSAIGAAIKIPLAISS
jgi:hypothetical protein